jgi:hypothetical protein
MFRRSTYDAAGGYDERVVPADDHDLWLRMAEVAEIATISEPLLRYRRSPEAMSIQMGDRMTRASVDVAVRAIDRTAGVQASERIVQGLRVDPPILTCADASAVVDVVVPVYSAIERACRGRGIVTRALPGQLVALLAAGGLRAVDGSWCRRGLAHLARHHPRVTVALGRERFGAKGAQLRGRFRT